MLRADHEKVSDLFAKYESARAATVKNSLVARICRMAARKAELTGGTA